MSTLIAKLMKPSPTVQRDSHQHVIFSTMFDSNRFKQKIWEI